jgi:hypothetical protein
MGSASGRAYRSSFVRVGRVSAERRVTPALARSGDPPQTHRLRIGSHLFELVLACSAAAALLLFFLAIYRVKHYPMPIGYDTPRYLFQTTLAGHFGLANVPHVLPPPSRSLATRTGFPVVALTLSKLLAVSLFKAAAVIPGAAATALGLAAGAFVSWALRRDAWEFAAVALVVGTSTLMVRLLAPETYTDNLLSTAVLVAALVPILSVVRDGPGMICAIALLGLGGVIHPQFFGLFMAILALVAVLYLPGSWRAWRNGSVTLFRTPAARLGLVLGAASSVAAVGFLGALRSSPIGIKQTRFELAKKLRQDVPLYRFSLTVPLAAIGAGVVGALGFGRSRERGVQGADGHRPGRGTGQQFAARFILALSLAWATVTVFGLVAYRQGTGVAAHRLLSFFIPLPLLVALGILGLGKGVAARTRTAAGVAIVLTGIGAFAFLGYRDLYVNLPRTRGSLDVLGIAKVQQATAALTYLERSGVAEDAPVVFVIDDLGPNPLSFIPEMAYMIRSVLPAQRILHVYIYVGDPENYLAGKPTYRDRPDQYNSNVRRYWPTIQRLLPRRPVALLLAAYNPSYRRFAASHPDSVITPNVALLAGPRPGGTVATSSFPTGPRGDLQGAILGVGTLVWLAVVGSGWALVGLPRTLRPFEVIALCPAFGIAALVAGGILVDAAGFRLSGIGGALTPVLVAAAGFLVARRLRRPGRAA